MLSLVLALILVYVILGIIGFVVKGLFWLVVVAVVLFLVTITGASYRGGRRRGKK